MQEDNLLCPFKKIVERAYNKKTCTITVSERFASCAKERCVAYSKGDKCKCMKLKQNKEN